MSNLPTTDPALLEALEKAKHHVMTPEEHAAQRRSFVRGMCPSHRDYSEWCEQVDKVLGVQDRADTIESLRAENAALKAKLAETEKQVYAPGQWRCAKCKFTLTQMAIYADTGVISTNDVPGEKCPNCDGPLWRVTERQCANELGERLEEIAGRAFEAERKLAEREGELTAEEMRERCANYLDEYADGFQEYDDWRPIETAPKDGTRVLLYVPPYGPSTGHYRPDHNWGPEASNWHAHSILNKEAEPTHWIPLPPKPQRR